MKTSKICQIQVNVFSLLSPAHIPNVVPASGLETEDTMTKPKPSFSPRWISTSYGCRAAGTTALPLPPPPPLPMPLVEPLPELTVLREFWLPWGVRLPSVREGAWVLLWWEEAGEGGTSPSPLDPEMEEGVEDGRVTWGGSRRERRKNREEVDGRGGRRKKRKQKGDVQKRSPLSSR